MAIILGNIHNNAIQSGASFNIADVQNTSTHSKMVMQGAAGSFNIGNKNNIYNDSSGNLLPALNDPDAVDIIAK
jgi:uncharacterized Fe-S cluster protein YjdI